MGNTESEPNPEGQHSGLNLLDDEQTRELCSFGKNCYRLNEEHLRHKKHPHLESCFKVDGKDFKVVLPAAPSEKFRMQVEILKGVLNKHLPKTKPNSAILSQNSSEKVMSSVSTEIQQDRPKFCSKDVRSNLILEAGDVYQNRKGFYDRDHRSKSVQKSTETMLSGNATVRKTLRDFDFPTTSLPGQLPNPKILAIGGKITGPSSLSARTSTSIPPMKDKRMVSTSERPKSIVRDQFTNLHVPREPLPEKQTVRCIEPKVSSGRVSHLKTSEMGSLISPPPATGFVPKSLQTLSATQKEISCTNNKTFPFKKPAGKVDKKDVEELKDQVLSSLGPEENQITRYVISKTIPEGVENKYEDEAKRNYDDIEKNYGAKRKVTEKDSRTPQENPFPTVIVPPLDVKDFNMSGLFCARVVSLEEDGTSSPTIKNALGKIVEFDLEDLKNISKTDITLKIGHPVKYRPLSRSPWKAEVVIIEEDMKKRTIQNKSVNFETKTKPDSSPEDWKSMHKRSVDFNFETKTKPEMSPENSKSIPNDNNKEKDPEGRKREKMDPKGPWKLGQVSSVVGEKVFLSWNDNKIFMHRNKISTFALNIKIGDLIIFVLSKTSTGKNPSVLKAKMESYSYRTFIELKTFMDNLKDTLGTARGFVALTELALIPPLWECLGNSICTSNNEAYAFCLLDLLEAVGKRKTEPEFTAIMKTVFGTNFFNNLAKILEQQDFFTSSNLSERVSYVSAFVYKVALLAPQFTDKLKPISYFLSSYGSSDEIQSIIGFLMDALAHSFEHTDNGNWRSMAPVPSEEELLGGLLSENKLLRSVHRRETYSCSEEYMDIYYRLLRAECFSAVQKGIKDFLGGKLDERDMNCYHELVFAGMNIGHSGISIGVQFKSEKRVKDWTKSSKLMLGNLLCLSTNRQFDDPIWATVSDRDAQLLNKSSIIFIEICQFNNKNMPKIIDELQSNNRKTFMVESPTYFHSLQPILDTLKTIELDDFVLQKEIITAKNTFCEPDYSRISSSSCVDEDYNPNYFENEDGAFKHFEAERNAALTASKISKILDCAQLEAFNYALETRLAVIQGPPGCGKTFLGIKLVEVLLKRELQSPILVLTYKNHALDEFLKGVLELPDCSLDDIVRIGSRSNEPMLEPCNLNKIIREANFNNAIFDELFELRQFIDEKREVVKHHLDIVQSYSSITPEMILEHLSDDQLNKLLVSAPWKKKPGDMSLCFKINKTDFVTQEYLIKKLLPSIKRNHGSLSEFITLCLVDPSEKFNTNDVQLCKDVMLTAAKFWMPSKEKLKEWSKLNETYVQNMIIDDDKNEGEEDNANIGDDFDDFDVDAIQEILEGRMTYSNVGDRFGKKSTNPMMFFPTVENRDDPHTFHISDFPSNLARTASLINEADLWKLAEVQRSQFLYSLLSETRKEVFLKFDNEMRSLEDALNDKKRLELTRKINLISKKKIIGVTITGASINQDLLNKVAPSVVLVEEAAEILEPSLLAALNPSVEHLILIGDNKQLPPQVDTYELQKKYSFDTSMMERLVLSGYDYKALKKQNRMRPEFSAMLKDIYPELEDNLERVSNNQPPSCIKDSMYFWSHEHVEDAEKKKNAGGDVDRSKKNTKEAEMVVSLTLFLLCGGYKPSQITILTGYLGQQKLLRQMIKEEEKGPHQGLFSRGKDSSKINVQTIDNYQGDENEIIIISLVRCNARGDTGFLNVLNRRCVAQSRAKCGMYFVGHVSTFSSEKLRKGKSVASVWTHIIDEMGKHDCIGESINLQCWKHKNFSIKECKSTSDVMGLVSNPKMICSLNCGDLYPCNRKDHACEKSCLPKHRHDLCKTEVEEIYPECAHMVRKKCYEKLSELPCQTKVDITYRCGHQGQKKCHVDESKLHCHHPCEEVMSYCNHKCPDKCGNAHSHDYCKANVTFEHPICGHNNKKYCYEPELAIKCSVKVQKGLKCGHRMEAVCYQSASEITCTHPCGKIMDCGKHNCKIKCGQAHNHNYCDVFTDYSFPKCNHPSLKWKKCSEEIKWPCKFEVVVKLPKCNHSIKAPCYKKNDVKCHLKEERVLACGHKMEAICSMPSSQISCTHPCAKMMSCASHKCKKLCGQSHSHNYCEEMVNYKFPKCHHPSPMRKKCSEEIKWPCKYEITAVLPSCGHPCKKQCHVPIQDVVCDLPCSRKRKSCEHPCRNKCGEDCEKGKCNVCDRNFRELKKSKLQIIEKKIKEMEAEVRRNPKKVIMTELKDHGDTKAEYTKVRDKVLKYNQPMHNFNPFVIKIEKVENKSLELNFHKARMTALGDEIDLKFHGTSDDGVKGIVKEGFRMPGLPLMGQRPGMYGQGIYFATDSSKSAQAIYTKNSNKLLLCEVLLGKSKEVRAADSRITYTTLQAEGYDSVFAPRGSAVMNDEFVVYKPEQVLPKYVIHYNLSGTISSSIPKAIGSGKAFEKIELFPAKRQFDPNDSKAHYFRIAESHFRKMSDMGSRGGINYRNKDITKIDYIINKKLETNFQKKKSEFKRRGHPDHEVLAFHGTPGQNIDSILQTNLDPNRTPANGRAHGDGCYFSEFPDVSLGYGNGLLLFRTLPGKEYVGSSRSWDQEGCHSKVVSPTGNEKYGQMLIIKDATQFMPYFVYHFN